MTTRTEEDRQRERDSGLGNQVKGKANEVAGAVRGDTGQELKGKVQKNVGKAQQRLNEPEP
jgi:uncharacterized protein YjbJ (UPF0337 family)